MSTPAHQRSMANVRRWHRYVGLGGSPPQHHAQTGLAQAFPGLGDPERRVVIFALLDVPAQHLT
jgi:hypothetical protein